jgi:hypothetical protein
MAATEALILDILGPQQRSFWIARAHLYLLSRRARNSRMCVARQWSGRGLPSRSRFLSQGRRGRRWRGPREGCWLLVCRATREIGVSLCIRLELGRLWCTSLLPRPKPFMTGPRSFSGNGGCGCSGPAMGSRGPFGRTICRCWARMQTVVVSGRRVVCKVLY